MGDYDGDARCTNIVDTDEKVRRAEYRVAWGCCATDGMFVMIEVEV